MIKLSKKHERARENPKKPHGHECGICGKPRTYKSKQLMQAGHHTYVLVCIKCGYVYGDEDHNDCI